MGAFKLVRYVLDPNGREWLPVDTFIGGSDQLVKELTSLVKGKPSFVELIAPNEDVLILGIGGPVGTVGFGTLEMQREGRQIGATGTVGEDFPEWVEFDAGGTPSPINRDALVTVEDLLTIARYFFEKGELHPQYTWE